jgi:hypothetical protein
LKNGEIQKFKIQKSQFLITVQEFQTFSFSKYPFCLQIQNLNENSFLNIDLIQGSNTLYQEDNVSFINPFELIQ